MQREYISAHPKAPPDLRNARQDQALGAIVNNLRRARDNSLPRLSASELCRARRHFWTAGRGGLVSFEFRTSRASGVFGALSRLRSPLGS